MKKLFVASLIALIALSCSKKEEVKQEIPTIPSTSSMDTSGTSVVEQKIDSVTVSKSDIAEGKSLIEGTDCLTCHKTEGKLIGPSYSEIAQKYSENDIDLLADKIVNGGSGVWGEVPMAAHPGMSKENAKKMVTYILSLRK